MSNTNKLLKNKNQSELQFELNTEMLRYIRRFNDTEQFDTKNIQNKDTNYRLFSFSGALLKSYHCFKN